ncbi:hypothetical protein [Candidatus Rariloculus sp.]|uniref:hypothetical protein n=1 Tax=Candidatus Rariloculus sp. TaxID=3101265 RepID=UPI003D137259
MRKSVPGSQTLPKSGPSRGWTPRSSSTSNGAAREDGVTPEIAQEIARIGGEILSDEAALQWMYNGGTLP